MFGFGRRRAIERRAKALGDQMVWLLGMINTMTFEEFIESAARQGFVEGYRDMRDKEYGFSREKGTRLMCAAPRSLLRYCWRASIGITADERAVTARDAGPDHAIGS